MKKNPKVFICLLHHDGQKTLRRTLSDIFRLQYDNFETILINNGSCDNLAEQVKLNFPKITLIKNKANIGSSAGYNLGIKYALERGANYILLLNQGVIFEKNIIDIFVNYLEKNSKISLASPIIFKNEEREISFFGGKINWLAMKTAVQKKRIEKDNTRTHFLKEGAIIIKKKVFKKIGLLDEDFFMSWGLIDFSVRARKAGCHLSVCAETSIIYPKNFSLKRKYWEKLGRLLFFRKNAPLFFRPWINFRIFFLKNKNLFIKKKNRGYLNELDQKIYSDLSFIAKKR